MTFRGIFSSSSLLCIGIMIGVASAGGGCTKSEADLREEDRPKIELIIEQDVRASKAMAEADDAARHGNPQSAVDAVDQRAKPAIEAGLQAAAIEPKSAWGRAKRTTLASILTDRKAATGPYSEAVKSEDPQKLIDAMEAQARIERRALAVVAEVREGR